MSARAQERQYLSKDRTIQESSHHQNINQNSKLEKYQVVKLMSSGDYVCNDHFGNTYLLVCQTYEKGLEEFKSNIKVSFHRDSSNRALLTPFQDIQHDGLTFSVYMLPQRAIWIGDLSSLKFKSQIFCLSLLYSLINKILKPLLFLFGRNADKWLNFQNIWIKQSTIFFVLNARRKKTISNDTSRKSAIYNEFDQSILSNETTKQGYEKFLLRKLCNILIPFFRIDPQLKSFLSIITDALLNEQFTIDQACFLLKDKKRRRQFMNERKQVENIQQEDLRTIINQNNDKYRKRNIYLFDTKRRQLKSKTINIQSMQRSRPFMLYNENVRKVGETINIPPSLSVRRSSQPSTGLFDFKNKTVRNKSLSNDISNKPNRRYSRMDNSINVSQKIQQQLKYQIKNLDFSSKKYCSISVSIQQRAYRKFCQNLDQSRKSIGDGINKSIEQQDKYLREYLDSKSKQKNRKWQTIDVGQLKQNRFNPIMHKEKDLPIRNQNDSQQLKKRLFSKFSEQQQKANLQVPKNNNMVRFQTNQSQIQKQKQTYLQKKQNYKIIEKQRQRLQIKQTQKLSENQVPNQKWQKLLQNQQNRKQKQKQEQKQKQKQKQQQIQKQKKQNMKKEQQKLLKEKQINLQLKKKQSRESKQSDNQVNQKNQLPKNSSMGTINKNHIPKSVQQIDVDKIQMIEPKLKQQINKKKEQQIKKQAEKEKQKYEKFNKPPLPINQTKAAQPKNTVHEDQLEQIVLDNKKKNETQQLKKQGNERKDDKNPTEDKKNNVIPSNNQKQKKNENDKQQVQSMKRTRTIQSQIASSCGPKKPVSKQVTQYIYMINKMGQGVAKSSRISAKLEGVQWFTGIYFVYKRFLYERKKIQKWLEKKEPNLTRYKQKTLDQWKQWFQSQQKKALEQKIKLENENIVSSILKMNKKIIKKKLPQNFLFHAALSKHSQQQSKIAVSEIVKEYDFLDQQQRLKDQQVMTHINEMMNALYIIAELDGKFDEKKPINQIVKKRNQDQLAQFSDMIYDLYIKEE